MTAPCEHCDATRHRVAAWLEQRADAHDADAAHLDAHPPAPRAPAAHMTARDHRVVAHELRDAAIDADLEGTPR